MVKKLAIVVLFISVLLGFGAPAYAKHHVNPEARAAQKRNKARAKQLKKEARARQRAIRTAHQ
jgi:hypothetical protein